MLLATPFASILKLNYYKTHTLSTAQKVANGKEQIIEAGPPPFPQRAKKEVYE